MADRLPPSLPGPMPSSFDDKPYFYDERPMQKILRKLKQEPLVLLGTGLTVFAFISAYRAIRRGDSQQANRMFRARVAAQGLTVMTMVAGSIFYAQDREKNKELRKLKEQRDVEEKRQKWIRELEIRDEETKALTAKLEQRKRAVQSQTPQAEAEVEPAPQEGAGGILGKMGLWPQAGTQPDHSTAEKSHHATAEKKANSDTAQAQYDGEGDGSKISLAQKQKNTTRPRKDNPKSSLGAIGEVLVSKKKDVDESPKSTTVDKSRTTKQ